jgi:Uma2 family endonuclease
MSAVLPVVPLTAFAPPALPDEPTYEEIDGQRVELPPMSVFANWIAGQLVGRLFMWAQEHGRGHAVMEILFRLPLPENRNRRPDVAFVSYERWPKGRPIPAEGNAWDVVPELAVEVVSPSDLAEELDTKIDEYFRAGVRQVWVVYPRRPGVLVFDSLTQVRGLTREHTLEGGDVLPGFRLEVAELFPEPAAS